jgi:hypothetical protein
LEKRDLEILKYHYSYGICKGTNLETFEKNHSDAKQHLRKEIKVLFYMNKKKKRLVLKQDGLFLYKNGLLIANCFTMYQ